MEDSTHEQPIDHDKEHTVSNGELSTTFATPEIPPDVLDTAGSATHDASQSANDIASDSTSSSRRQSANEQMLDDDLADGHLGRAKSASSRSSLSSVPDSVVVHSKADGTRNQAPPRTSDVYDSDISYNISGNPVQQKIRDRNSPFRHPSSVRAMQMYTEDEEDDYTTPSKRRGAGLRSPPMRSPGSPFARRQGYHSAGGTPKKPAVKTENPLVLLHCNVLPPTIILAPGLRLPDRKVLENILPLKFWRRWKLLEEKIIGSGLLHDRGVLLQHPQEDYGLLEERLLESLELQRPRLERGHFVGGDDRGESENESNNEDTESHLSSNSSHGQDCPDCGCHVSGRKGQKKWEVRFYAANGLMKEGAWTAAWKEIERIDVQVSLWLPYEVKTEVERQIHEEQSALVTKSGPEATQPSVEKPLLQEEIDGLTYTPQHNRELRNSHSTPYDTPTRRRVDIASPNAYRNPSQEIDLHTLFINYIRIVASDARNIITVASLLVAAFALFYGSQTRRNMSDAIRYGDFPAVSTQVFHTSSASVLTQISTEVPAVEVKKCVEGASQVQRVAEEVTYSMPQFHYSTNTVVSAPATETQLPVEQIIEPLVESADPQNTDQESDPVATSYKAQEEQELPMEIKVFPVALSTYVQEAVSPIETKHHTQAGTELVILSGHDTGIERHVTTLN